MAKGLLGNLRVRLTAETEDFRRGVGAARKNLNTFEKDVDRFGRRLKGALSLAAATAAATGLAVLIGKAADVADQIDKMSIRTGIARGTLQELKFAGDQLGVSFEAIAGVTEAFTRRIPSIQSGTGDTAEAFRALGVSLRDSKGQLRGMGELFPDIIRGLSGIENETQRNALATQLFGRKAFEIVPMLAAGGEELERLTKRARELGMVMGDSEIAKLVRYQDQMAEFKMQVAAVGQELAIAFLPAAEAGLKILSKMAGWVKAVTREIQLFGAALAIIPPAMNVAWQAITFNRKGLEQAKKQFREMKEAIQLEMAMIRWEGTSDNPRAALTIPAPEVPVAEAKEAGRKSAFLFFDGLKEEWEDLRHSVALRSISLTGSESDRLRLEEEHALRLLEIERQKLEARYKAQDVTWEELEAGRKELDERRKIAKARRQEFDAVDKALAKQRNVTSLVDSVTGALPGRRSGPGSDIGSKAATVLADKFNLGEKLGGLAGSVVLPGIGGLIGSGIASLFAKDEKKQDQQVQALNRIDKNTRQAADILELTGC